MRRIDEEATVVMLACLTEDRSPDEQRALLSMALRIDCERGAFTVTNPAPRHPILVAEARFSYDPSEGRRVDLLKPQRERFDRLLAQWALCDTCHQAIGRHGPDGCTVEVDA